MKKHGPPISTYLRKVAEDVEPFLTAHVEMPKPTPKPTLQQKTPEKVTMAAPVHIHTPVRLELPATIEAALRKKVNDDMRLVTEKSARLRESLEAYEAYTLLATERRVTNSVLVTLGQDPLPDVDGKEAQEDLIHHITELFDLVGGSSPFVAPAPVVEVQPASDSNSEPVSCERGTLSPTPTPEPPKSTTTPGTDSEKAFALIDEIETMSGNAKGQPYGRFGPLLQAFVAEARLYMESLPPSHPAHQRLSQLIPVLGAMKTEAGLQEFILGLAFNAQGDWSRISLESRRRVAHFDANAALEAEVELKPVSKSKDTGKQQVISIHSWPKLPALRAAMRRKPLIIVGGLVVNEKLALCASRFGIKPEWYEAEKDPQRVIESIAQKVRSGSPCAIILLEGLIGHKTSGKIIEACRAKGVPYVLADKGGTASLEAAFTAIDQRLAS